MHYFILLVIVIVVVIAITQVQKKKVNECWQTTAARLRLKYTPGGFFQHRVMRGFVDGFKVKIKTVTRQSGKHSKRHTVYHVMYPSLNLGLALRRQGIFFGISKLFGGQDIIIGHAAFDDAVVIRGRYAGEVERFLTLTRRMRIQRFFTAYRNSVITDTYLKAEVSREVSDPGRMIKTVKHLVQLAQVLTQEETSEKAINRAMDSRREGRLEDALEYVSEIIDESPENDVDARAMQGEILLAAGRRKEAAEVFQQVHEELPEDEEIQELSLQAGPVLPPIPPEAQAEPALEQVDVSHEALPDAPDREAPAPVLDSASLEDVSEALFAESRMSHETNKIFEENFKGKRVCWSGTLEWVTTYFSDMVFGQGPGTRAVFNVYRLAGDNYGGREVRAVVQLPETAQGSLTGGRGKTCILEGTLVSCDAFMRNLFLADGAVTEYLEGSDSSPS